MMLLKININGYILYVYFTAIMVPPTRPNVTRLADDKVMVRWSVPARESLPIQFFKVQYRLLGSTPKAAKHSQWMTSNDDIPPKVYMFEVEGLKPESYYRFRIAAVYSNNDNQLSNASKIFYLIRGDLLKLPSPNLTSVEPISETSIVLHWTLPEHNQIDVDGFYAYFRPASTAGEYSKATVDGMDKRSFQIDNLEPGTAYEFKLQSYTASAASDFMAIITGKTLSKRRLFYFGFFSSVIYLIFYFYLKIPQLQPRSIQVLLRQAEVLLNPPSHTFSWLQVLLELALYYLLHPFSCASL